MDRRYVFHILVDDAHGDNFFKILLEEPEVMPSIKKYIFDRGAYSKNCLASYVASSIPGHTALLTGVFPDRNNVPYAWYWNLEGPSPKKMDLSKVKIKTIKKWNKTISKEIKTTFEYVPDSASFTVVSRGARYKFFTVWKLIWAFILVKLKGVDFLEQELGFWEYMYLTQMKKLLKKIRKKGLPAYSFIVYPPSDSAAHKYGFDSQQYRTALNLLDRVVKLLIEGDHSDTKKPLLGLKDMGYFDDCMFVICSDHSSQKFNQLSDILADVRKLSLNIVSVNEPKINKKAIQNADSQKFNQLSDILADVRKLSLNIVSVNEPKINKKAIQNADITPPVYVSHTKAIQNAELRLIF
ncbi:MAG: alkaline phosphatase family protein [Candidatus Helarchaeota archaeon]